MIASIYARQDGTIAHVDDGTLQLTPDANTTLVVRFAIDNYTDEYQHIATNTKAAFWDGANLQIDSVVYLDDAWIAARQNEITQAENALAEDTNERAQLLALYQAALTQIGNDLDNVATGKAALPNATLAQTRVIIDGMLTILEHQLNREERELRVLRAILRSGLT